MATVAVENTARPDEPLQTDAPAPAPRRGKQRWRQVLVCQASGDRVWGVWARRRRDQVDVQEVVFTTPQEAAAWLREAGSRKRIVLVLPRPRYLIQTTQAPSANPDEVMQMLRLEVEAHLPPDYGDVQTAYRRLDAEGAVSQRYEVYTARRETLQDQCEALERLGLKPEWVVPSAVLWGQLLLTRPTFDLLVAQGPDGELETAAGQRDGSVLVRTVQSGSNTQDPGTPRGLIECIRPLLATADAADRPVGVGWLGVECPAASNGRVRFDALGDERLEPTAQLLGASARLLLEADTDPVQTLSASNLLPDDWALSDQRSQSLRQLAVGAGTLLAALLMVFVALKAATYRLGVVSDGLSAQIDRIRVDGAATGRRLDQLRAIQAAQRTHGDLTGVLMGLYEATPDGLTYNYVELTPERELHLRGQAEALSQPFLLPERLEPTPMFEQVSLRDASQSKKGRGSVAEFRADAIFTRSEGRP